MVIRRTVENLEDTSARSSTQSIWEIDRSIGGPGGYQWPLNPTIQPFRIGLCRDVLRPLQYAACYIEYNLAGSARWVVHSCGMYLERLMRVFICSKSCTHPLKRHTLGQSVRLALDRDLVEPNIGEALGLLRDLYNKAKHDVNEDDSRLRLFTSGDALVVYFASRVIENTLTPKLLPADRIMLENPLR